MRTASQITADFYKSLKSSELARLINGGVYHEGQRPANSRKEDAVVVFTAGLAGQVDSGTITVLVYVPDIDADGTGVPLENKRRTAEIASAALDWVKGMQTALTGYRIELSQAIATSSEELLRQHFVSVRISYESFDENE